MRISDWSSDVCSSDLGALTIVRQVAPQVNADLTELETVPARLKARVRQLEWGEEKVAEKSLMITPWLHDDWEGKLDASRPKSRPDSANQTVGTSRQTGSPQNRRPFDWLTGDRKSGVRGTRWSGRIEVGDRRGIT